jgi:hypothetical protein
MPREPGYWQRRAEDARRRAAERTDPLARQADVNAAEAYEALAKMAEVGDDGAAKTP